MDWYVSFSDELSTKFNESGSLIHTIAQRVSKYESLRRPNESDLWPFVHRLATLFCLVSHPINV